MTSMMTMPTTAILDGDMIAHRAAYITNDIEDLPMVMRQVMRTWTPPGCTHVLVAMSCDRGDNYRRTVWSEYKAHRDKLEVDEDQVAIVELGFHADAEHAQDIGVLAAINRTGK